MATTKSKISILRLWLLGGGVVFLVLVAQSLSGRYQERTIEVWEWFFPTVLPTTALLLGIVVADNKKKPTTVETDATRALRLSCMWLSVIYLLLVSATIFATLFVSTPPIDIMRMSHMWLAPMQALLTAFIGGHFRLGGTS